MLGPGRKRLMTSMPTPTAEQIEQQAQREGRTVSAMIKWAVECYLKRVGIAEKKHLTND